ncbi:MAG: hypothetical protein QOH00_214 [Gaiellales bacterium]|jgi:hypothetical protein|nr:hypothetical protein [Gaiellales bacterium]
MKRREGIGGVTIAVVGIVLALSVGIAATAEGGISAEAANQPTHAVVRNADSTATLGASTAPPDGVWIPVAAKGTTTRISVQTVVSQSAGSPSTSGGTCVVESRIVTSTDLAPRAQVRSRSEIRRHVGSRGGHAGQGSNA